MYETYIFSDMKSDFIFLTEYLLKGEYLRIIKWDISSLKSKK